MKLKLFCRDFFYFFGGICFVMSYIRPLVTYLVTGEWSDYTWLKSADVSSAAGYLARDFLFTSLFCLVIAFLRTKELIKKEKSEKNKDEL